jgi:hypothetical protein
MAVTVRPSYLLSKLLFVPQNFIQPGLMFSQMARLLHFCIPHIWITLGTTTPKRVARHHEQQSLAIKQINVRGNYTEQFVWYPLQTCKSNLSTTMAAAARCLRLLSTPKHTFQPFLSNLKLQQLLPSLAVEPLLPLFRLGPHPPQALIGQFPRIGIFGGPACALPLLCHD